MRPTIALHSKSILKPFKEIPSKRGLLPPMVDLLIAGGPSYLHEHCDKRHKQLGPIFRERLGSDDLVFVADTNLIQKTLAKEGLRPRHSVPKLWLYYNQVKSIDRGLFFQVGETWHKLRSAFNKVMLVNRNITNFNDNLLEINNDLFRYWELNFNVGNSILIHDIKQDLCKWSIESTGVMLFGNRLDCVPRTSSNTIDPRGMKLVQNVSQMFFKSSKLHLLPIYWIKLARKLNLNSWGSFEHASDEMLRIANEFSNEFVGQARQSNSKACLVKDLINLDELNDEEISKSVIDLIVASADTTSISLQWMLYLIAKYPDIQSKLRQEARQFLDGTFPSDLDDIYRNLPYHTAFIKETLRLYPTAPFLARTLDEDIVLNDYKIPKGIPIVLSLYTTSRSSQYFHRPLDFRPERWFRHEYTKSETRNCPGKKVNSAFASLPFGHGSRKCVGHKAANLEMCLFVASFVSKFDCSLHNTKDEINAKLTMTLCPDRPINLNLIPRR